MQAIVIQDGQLQYVPDYPQPEPAPGEALIKILVAGICSTDLEIIRGYGDLQGVLGHEFVGVVEAVAKDEDAGWIGRRVVGTISLGCQTCHECLSRGFAHCPNRTTVGIIGRDGVFADYVCLPVANLLEVPESVAPEAAVFTEPLAAALRIREQIRIPPGQEMAVIGPGRLGLLVGLVLALDGSPVRMLGRSLRSLDLPAMLGLATGLTQDFPDNQYDFVVEVTGNAAGFAEALRLVRPLGTMVLKSTFAGDVNFNLTKLVVSEINLVGSRCGPFAPALRLLAQGVIPTNALVEATYPLAHGLDALTHAARPGVRKVLLYP
ncbi:MAG: alcohol dehydrogenase catalytic domain-containing protein [Ardenticatenales bacterium]|nr:alcohol dehydrogenase catalytic domain-containing protein [Ardenticatenales bacterium]